MKLIINLISLCDHATSDAQPASAVSFVPPLTPMTPLHGSVPGSFEYSDVWGPCEDLQTSRESDYLFDPPQRWSVVPVLTPVESAQTRQDAADVLFEPPLERSGGSAGTAIPKVKICHVRAPTDHAWDIGVCRITHEPQRGRVRGREPHSRGRDGGRGPRDEMS
jgi:hypothetical protein